MKVTIQIKSVFGTVLFEYERANNTIKQTVEEAKKQGANLRGADLRSANLYRADLYRADLYRANLRGADLYGADLRSANLRGADLYRADLYGADLRGADLYGADLRSANLRGADLYGADLRSANLRGADLEGAKNMEYVIAQTRILQEGDLIVYKTAYDEIDNKVVIKLLIPKEAKRSSAFGRKCRAEFADVLEIEGATKAFSYHNRNFVYEVGKRVAPEKPFSEDWMEECASGIHFFITKLEAEKGW